MAAGARYIAAQLGKFSGSTNQVILSQITHSNITDNAYGALNLQADGVTAATGNPNATIFQNFGNLLKAEGNWWGLRDQAATNPGPAISPTTNPAAPESPVNGTATAETATGGTTSNAVDFFPYRDGNAANPATGEYPVLTAPIPMSDAAPTVSLSGPATAAPGSTFALTAAADDDFGVKRVRFADGATSLGIATVPPYTQSVSVPSDAACDSTHTYSAVAMDSLGQTTAVAAGDRQGRLPDAARRRPHATATARDADPGTSRAGRAHDRLALVAVAAEGLRRGVVRAVRPGRPAVGRRVPRRPPGLRGHRPPCACTVHATGADVGGQSLRLVVTDALGRTAELQRSISVAKFASALKLSVAKHVSGAKATRTISGRLTFPSAVTKQQGCSGTVTLVVRRAGHSVLNQQVPVSKTCTFKRSLTAGRKAQSFSASARFGGNAVLTTANETRRFS